MEAQCCVDNLVLVSWYWHNRRIYTFEGIQRDGTAIAGDHYWQQRGRQWVVYLLWIKAPIWTDFGKWSIPNDRLGGIQQAPSNRRLRPARGWGAWTSAMLQQLVLPPPLSLSLWLSFCLVSTSLIFFLPCYAILFLDSIAQCVYFCALVFIYIYLFVLLFYI